MAERTAFRRRRLPTVVVAVSAIAGSVVAAAAATLGGVTAASISAFAFAASTGAPTVLVWENFDGTNGTNLSGTITDGGAKTWASAGGTWTISGNRAISTSAVSAIGVNMGTGDVIVEATLHRGGTTWDVGLTADANTGFTQYLTAEWTSNTNGSLEVWKYNGGWVALGSATGLYPGGVSTAPASITVRLTAVGSTFAASINGTPRVSVTLSAADQTTYKNASHPWVGIFVYQDGASTIDNLHVDQ